MQEMFPALGNSAYFLVVYTCTHPHVYGTLVNVKQ